MNSTFLRFSILTATVCALAVALFLIPACSTHTFYDSSRTAGSHAHPGSGRAPVIAGPFDEVWVLALDRARDRRRPAPTDEREEIPGTGTLAAIEQAADGGERHVPLPLEHTGVEGTVTGPVTSVSVRQRFGNPFSDRIEAVYVFPLPHDAAVSDFVMTVGERRIRGIIREREEAERAYADARYAGYVAALLTEERPNIFTQRVANIEPGRTVDVEITYYGVVGYEEGWHEWVFPMVVGPRFNPPGSADPILALPRDAAAPAGGTNMPYLAPGERSAHEVDLLLTIDAGTAIHEIRSPSHRVVVDHPDSTRAVVRLAEEDRLPNRDFVLRWRVAGEHPVAALASSADPTGGRFVLTLYPPLRHEASEAPLEMVFVLDRSGSMRGEPIAQAKAALHEALARLRPNDTFQLIAFSDDASSFGLRPVIADRRNLDAARRWVDQADAGGGTMVLTGLRAALDFPHDEERVRYIVFLTDGYIGNEREIFREVHQRLGASRIFSIGVGSSVNRHLLDGLARMGNGASTVMLDTADARTTMAAFLEQVRRPVLHDLRIDWGGAQVSDVYPRRLPDLHAGRPVVIVGRCDSVGARTIAIEGRIAGEPVRVPVAVEFAGEPTNSGLAKIGARTQIADLSFDALREQDSRSTADHIRAVALASGILSPYTAFIAVDASRVTEGTGGTTVHQAVPVPRGVRYETTVQGAHSALGAE